MEKVVERNAANAEESAAAGEEMNAQAVQTKDIVSLLVSLVQGTDAAQQKERERAGESKERTGITFQPPETATNEASTTSKHQEISPKQVIPLAAADFVDF